MDLNREYSNAAFIPGAADYPARWATQAAAFRGRQRWQALTYGPGPRQRLDLFWPDAPVPKGLMVFLHGGYWHLFGREDWSHLAAGALARDWACAIPSYTLAPAARISAMVAEVSQAVQVAAAHVAGPVVVTGHSAGGHLAARLACADQSGPLARVVPISPLAELDPLCATAMNDILRLDAAESAAQSPARLALRPDVRAHIWVGAQERPAFLWQARTLAEAWACDWTVRPNRHHFDVIDELADPYSALINTVLTL